MLNAWRDRARFIHTSWNTGCEYLPFHYLSQMVVAEAPHRLTSDLRSLEPHTSKSGFFFFFIFNFGSERHELGRSSRERGRQRMIWIRLHAHSREPWCGARTHEPWDHDLSWSETLSWLSHPGAPQVRVLTLRSTFLADDQGCCFALAWCCHWT